MSGKFDYPNKERVITLEEVAKHNKDDDAWIIVDGKCVLLSFRAVHAGGAGSRERAGQRANEQPSARWPHCAAHLSLTPPAHPAASRCAACTTRRPTYRTTPAARTLS
jgi:hypothetical protein